MSTPDDLPPTWTSLRRSMRLAYDAEPRLLVVSFVLVAASWVPDSLGALWLKLLAQGVIDDRPSLVAWGAAGLAGSVTAGWLLRTVGGRLQMLFRERATVALEAHVARLQAGITGIEHHERPEFLDRLALLRSQVFLLNHFYESFMSTVGSLARLLLTVALLMSVHASLVALAIFAVPTVLVASWRASKEREATESAEPHARLARHFFDLATAAGPGKELRVGGYAALLPSQRRAAWDEWYRRMTVVRFASACWHAAAWALFGTAYVGAVVFVASGLDAPAGDVLLVVAAGANLSRYLGVTVAQAEFLRWTLDASRRLVWLERYAAAGTGGGSVPVPATLTHGIRFDNVSFKYPGTDTWVLRDVTLDLPAGGVVAIVGENGAGKTTLVKLLCRFYEPTTGSIEVDGVPLSDLQVDEWRQRLCGAFQDFLRVEFRAAQTIGLGDLERIDEVPALEAAVARGGAQDVLHRLPRGLDTQLGPTWDGGVELSFGQWQKLALARGLMRDEPLLCVLDEPTASLDSETEHALFERFAAASRTAQHTGRITVLVSHRFSTVRMADLIVVLDGSRVVEFGDHDTLMAKRGLYAELYGLQAAGYR